MVTALDALRDLVRRHCVGHAASTPIPRLEIRTGPAKTSPLPAIYPTMVCFVLQGAKRVAFGGRTLVYRGESYLLLSADLPVTGQVIEATPRAPYLAVSLLLDPAAIADLVIRAATPPSTTSPAGLGIGRLTVDLQDPLLRLLRLLDAPRDIRVLAPLAERELLYRLLQGPHGGLLRQLAIADSRLSQVRRAIEWIRADVARTLRVGTLAAHVGMSAASFHRHFKAVTGLSPLQYQKQIRLQEARRRLLAEPGDVTSVALGLAARGGSPAAFDGRSIPALGVARRSNIPDILAPRALIAGRLARLGATRHFHHGLLAGPCDRVRPPPSPGRRCRLSGHNPAGTAGAARIRCAGHRPDACPPAITRRPAPSVT